MQKRCLKWKNTGATVEELEKLGTGKLRLAAVDGDVKEGSVMSGQVASMVTKREPVKDIIEGLMRDLETAEKDLFNYFNK